MVLIRFCGRYLLGAVSASGSGVRAGSQRIHSDKWHLSSGAHRSGRRGSRERTRVSSDLSSVCVCKHVQEGVNVSTCGWVSKRARVCVRAPDQANSPVLDTDLILSVPRSCLFPMPGLLLLDFSEERSMLLYIELCQPYIFY